MKKIVFITLLTFLFAAQIQAQHGLAQNESYAEVVLVTSSEFGSGFILTQDTTTVPVFKKRQPGTAFVLSFVLSGAGQIYNGQNGKGAIMMGTSIIGFVLFTNGVEEPPFATRLVTSPAGTVGLVLLVGSGLWSMIDAPVVATKLNRANGLAFRLEPSLHYMGDSRLALGPKLSLKF